MLKAIAAMCVLPFLGGCGTIPGFGGTPAPSPFSAAADKFLADYTTYHRLEMGKQAIDQSPVILPMPAPVVVTPNAPGAPPVVVTPVPAPTLPGPVVTPSLRQQKRRGAMRDQIAAERGFWAEHPPGFRLVVGPLGISAAASEADRLNAAQLQ